MVHSDLLRVDREFQDMIEHIRAERVIRGTDKRSESPRRISKVIAKMVNTDAILRNTLVNVELENDRKFTRRIGRRR
jgi:hypothetical protein